MITHQVICMLSDSQVGFISWSSWITSLPLALWIYFASSAMADTKYKGLSNENKLRIAQSGVLILSIITYLTSYHLISGALKNLFC